MELTYQCNITLNEWNVVKLENICKLKRRTRSLILINCVVVSRTKTAGKLVIRSPAALFCKGTFLDVGRKIFLLVYANRVLYANVVKNNLFSTCTVHYYCVKYLHDNNELNFEGI